MRSAWLVRAGRAGEHEKEALQLDLVIIGWRVPDLSQFDTKGKLRRALAELFPARSAYVVGNWTGQLWRFAREMTDGDLVVMPLKSENRLAIGEVVGSYRYRADAEEHTRHVRQVRWLRIDVTRDEFDADLRNSLGSLLTVCQLRRHDAPQRIELISRNEPDPGWRHAATNVDPDATRADLWDAVTAGSGPVRLTIRELLAMWGFSRRTATSESVIQAELAERGLTTRPSFTTGAIDSVLELVEVDVEPTDEGANAEAAASEDDLPVKWLVGAVLPADGDVESVQVGSTLTEAMTRMLATNYSQLAVVDEHGHYQGAVTWESIGRARLSDAEAGLAAATVQVSVVDYDNDLFEQIDEIYRRGYVLVRGEDRKTLIGIVTAHDLARQFGVLARPFSLVEEAELRLRRQVLRTLPEELVSKHVPPWGNGAPTFGRYHQLLDKPETFRLLGWPLDRETFLRHIDKVVAIRNELMHFSSDTLPAHDLEIVEGFVSMLRTVDR